MTRNEDYNYDTGVMHNNIRMRGYCGYLRGLWKNHLYARGDFAMLGMVPYISAAEPTIYALPNPLGKTDTVTALIGSISAAVIQIALPIAVVAIIVVGLRLLIAAVSGETGKITEAKKMLWWVLIGTAVVVGSSALALAVTQFVQDLGA